MIDLFFKISYYTFVTLIVCLGILLLLSSFPKTNIGVKIVQSGSMEPAIKTGSIVVIHQKTNYQVGDIITFFFNYRDTVPTTHRITEVSTEDGEVRYQTKGDANESQDPQLIEKEVVIGKVLFSVPYVGYILDFAKKPLGFTLIIGLPAAFVIFDEILKINAEVRKTRQEEMAENPTEEPHV